MVYSVFGLVDVSADIISFWKNDNLNIGTERQAPTHAPIQ